MPAKPHSDHTVSLWRPHGKGDLDIIRTSEGKCNRGITNILYENETRKMFEILEHLLYATALYIQ